MVPYIYISMERNIIHNSRITSMSVIIVQRIKNMIVYGGFVKNVQVIMLRHISNHPLSRHILNVTGIV